EVLAPLGLSFVVFVFVSSPHPTIITAKDRANSIAVNFFIDVFLNVSKTPLFPPPTERAKLKWSIPSTQTLPGNRLFPRAQKNPEAAKTGRNHGGQRA